MPRPPSEVRTRVAVTIKQGNILDQLLCAARDQLVGWDDLDLQLKMNLFSQIERFYRHRKIREGDQIVFHITVRNEEIEGGSE